MRQASDDRRAGPLAIIVMGVSGSGKSTLGLAVATALGCPFLEGDDYHADAAVAKMRAGDPLTDDDRWPWLDRLGQAIGETTSRDGRAVAACSALRHAYRDRLIRAVGGPIRFVLLDPAREELQRRVAGRPRHYMPPSLLDSQLDTLERPGADEQAIVLASDAPVATLCEQVLAWIGRESSARA